MEKGKLVVAIRKKVRVQKWRRAEITDLPFPPGSQVEIIIVGSKPKKGARQENIYAYTDSLTRRKGLPRYSMKQIEEIIHESREARG